MHFVLPIAAARCKGDAAYVIIGNIADVEGGGGGDEDGGNDVKEINFC